ncbi:hypothetical protein D3C86_2099860 [compost metagenome]
MIDGQRQLVERAETVELHGQVLQVEDGTVRGVDDAGLQHAAQAGGVAALGLIRAALCTVLCAML